MKKLVVVLVVFALIFSCAAAYAGDKASKCATKAQPVEKTGNIFEDFVTLITKQIPNTPRSDTFPKCEPATGKKTK